jgi:hypothetical protein
LLQADPLSSKEEECEIDKVKVEVDDVEVTVKEHGITPDISDDSEWLVGIYNYSICLQYIYLVLSTGHGFKV